jgi:hypothetical protein
VIHYVLSEDVANMWFANKQGTDDARLVILEEVNDDDEGTVMRMMM